jgi:hypothetical protein
MALGLTQPLREMGTRNLPGGKKRPARRADNLTAICEPTVWKMWEPRRLTNLWASAACYRDIFTTLLFTLMFLFQEFLIRKLITILIVSTFPLYLNSNYLQGGINFSANILFNSQESLRFSRRLLLKLWSYRWT